jgi:hypothetical protein
VPLWLVIATVPAEVTIHLKDLVRTRTSLAGADR